MATCFAIMPFTGFNEISEIIAEAARECGLQYVRGDHHDQPGMVLSQIQRDINNASVLVADVTLENANVFYELGIAHQLKGPERVVIITQKAREAPFDISGFRHFVYEHSQIGRQALRQQLAIYLRSALDFSDDEDSWKVIRGRLPRTRLIARDLKRLIETATPAELANITIRVISGLSSLAISNHEPPDPSEPPEYPPKLREERDNLIKALEKGAKLKAILHPPRQFASTMIPERLLVRYRRLLGLFDGVSDIKETAAAEVAAIKQCEFSLTPVPTPNLFIIGDKVAYEGMKRGGNRGYEMTHCETDPRAVRELISQFDNFFDASRQQFSQPSPVNEQVVVQLRRFYREAVETMKNPP